MDVIQKLSTLPCQQAAPFLLGKYLVRTLDNGTQLTGKIVETEAYHQEDEAAHSFRGKTPSNSIMFGSAGYLYVYFTYGMHYCFNVVCGPKGSGEAILIRAIEPLKGIELMKKFRHTDKLHQLTNGPAKSAQAFQISKNLNGHDLKKPPFQLMQGDKVQTSDIVTTKRIGITKNTTANLRFYIKNNPFVSKT
ncbi:DNA-3-methyladenine glycosylase [Candidatus Saccharibacteria bacterium CPR2]|nr:DNA-3-methyladenine glycosylase [Candidatus Saccharibacteria bacterium CPR2]